MKYVVYILLSLSLMACGRIDPQTATEPSVFSLWKSAELGDLDLRDGREGIFEMVVYREYASNPYRCFVTVQFSGNEAQVLNWYQDRAFVGAECRPLFEDMVHGGLRTFSLDVVDQTLEVSTKQSDGSKTLAWVFVQ